MGKRLVVAACGTVLSLVLPVVPAVLAQSPDLSFDVVSIKRNISVIDHVERPQETEVSCFRENANAFRRAVGAGASAVGELQNLHWGDRVGLVRDLSGHLWSLATRLR